MDTTEWEDALLYHAIWGQAEQVFELVTPDDFTPGDRQHTAEIVQKGLSDGPIHPQWVKDKALENGRPTMAYIAFVSSAGFTGTVPYYAERLRQATTRRLTTAAYTRAIQLLNDGTDPLEVIDHTNTKISEIPQPTPTTDDTWTLQDLLALDMQNPIYTIPNMLLRNERLVLTGSEGGGKSVFIYQLLTGASYGIDTLTLDRFDPQRILFIDVENNKFQARANLDKIIPTLQEMAPDIQPEWRSMKQRVINLLDTKDKSSLLRRINHYHPDILYMGTAYKLTDITDETHRSVRAIQSFVDKVRQDIDCTVIVEHHAGHGYQNDRNAMRPEGSSYWLRWPDFGYGMSPMNTPNRVMRLKAWRGDRVMGRQFPLALKTSGVFPWAPIYQDEFDALYAKYE
jgi:hypothetical protein